MHTKHSQTNDTTIRTYNHCFLTQKLNETRTFPTLRTPYIIIAAQPTAGCYSIEIGERWLWGQAYMCIVTVGVHSQPGIRWSSGD